MRSPREHALGLLNKAANDLVAARAILATGQALDTVCFHAQQATEKGLKALLAVKDIVYPRRHDLGELMRLVEPHYPTMTPLEDQVLQLSPYAVELRYDDTMTPDADEAGEAVEIACRVYALAEEIIALT